MQVKPSYLVLEDGTCFEGYSPPWLDETIDGEVVFTTGMTGYPESLTDPSYRGQILTFTYPLIGNYGVPAEARWESGGIHARGVVVSESCQNWSHSQGERSLEAWLRAEGVALISGVDTRALTKRLRTAGTMLGAITFDPAAKPSFRDPNIDGLVSQVTTHESTSHGQGEFKVIVVDCGMKENIMRCLQQLPIELKRVPFDYDYSDEQWDGVFLSNGPGDPTYCAATVDILRKAMKQERPIFGICLGTQLMALAAGATTYKLPYGHRSHNQPCVNTQTGQCYITSQNHGYAIDGNSLPEGWYVSYRNLNDQSVEGIAHRTLPFSAVQFHPEAAPGPTDSMWLFDSFFEQLKSNKIYV